MSDELEQLERWKRQADDDYLAQEDQRERANEDMRFVTVQGAQWEGFLDDVYGGGKRPRFEYDKLASAVNRFMSEWQTNRAQVRFRPDDDRANDDDASLLEGLFRRDLRRNDGQFAIDNAVGEAARCGVGAFRFATDWQDDEQTVQVVSIEPVYGAHSTVLWDLNARRMDKADARRCTIISEYSKDAHSERWPDAEAISVDYTDMRDRGIDWINRDSVFVAERYEVEEKKEAAKAFINPATLKREVFFVDQINLVMDEMELMGFRFIEDLKVKRRRVFKVIYNGKQILEKRREIAGKHIPVIPLYGFWAWVDGIERYWGIPTMRKDAQRLFNMQISRMAEVSASSPRRTPIFHPAQVDDPKGVISDLLGRAHTEDLPYVLLNSATDAAGNPIPLGPLGYLEPAQLDQNATALLEVTGAYLQQETGGAPQDVLDPSASGKAILAQAQRIDMDTHPIMDNIRAGIRRAGEVYRSIAADIYNTARSVTLVGEDGAESRARLMSTVIDRQTGRPVVMHDITKGRYEVVVDTGPSYQSNREATVANIKDVLAGLPDQSIYREPMMAVLIDSLSGVGLDQLKEFNRRQMVIAGLRKPETPEEEQALMAAQQPAQPTPADQLLLATAAKEASTAELNKVRAHESMTKAALNQAQAADEMAQARQRRQERLFGMPASQIARQ